ncbi:Flp family type IVb pilin [Chelatococcus sambhunathii]|uniref:Flp family type IVb pilin n=1 Tax=Chelatococcus sambhunathii TaxID=363953 RepID=A0ABU1DGP6_9HYPH|nr:Flp family type IVb pilin [Chelatococcus sambhunathii]
MRAMMRVCRALTRFRTDERGATAIEYAMIAVGIGIAVAATVFGVGTSLKVNFYDKMNAAVQN